MRTIYVENKSELQTNSLNEVMQVDVKKEYTVKVEDFFDTYYRTLASLYDLTCNDDIKVLTKLATLADNVGRILLPAPLRNIMCKELKIHTTNLSKSIKRLKEKHLIEGERGYFLINPNVFWRGEEESRNKILTEDGLHLTIKFKI